MTTHTKTPKGRSRTPHPPKRKIMKQRYRPIQDPETGQEYVPVVVKGKDIRKDPFLNKGTAFPEDERDALGLRGHLPPVVASMEQQLARVEEGFYNQPRDLNRYLHLVALQDRNETLFYRFLLDHLDAVTPIVYTPTVGAACQQFSHIYRRPRGLYITAADRPRMAQLLDNVTLPDVRVIVATDGEGILGIGDQGAGGIGISIGKLTLYSAAAGIHPSRCLPIMLDVGTDNPRLRNDPFYLGVRAPRLRGEPYFKLLDAFVKEVEKRFPKALLQWEDLSRQNAWSVLDRYENETCSFNDDIQGTGAVALAGLVAAGEVTGRPLKDNRICVLGTGAGGGGIIMTLIAAMEKEGLNRKDALERIIGIDSNGPVLSSRKSLQPFKRAFARDASLVEGWKLRVPGRIGLLDVVRNFKPTILIGTSGKPGAFNEDVVRSMAANCDRPIILALSNPTSKTEVHPEDAIRWTDGKVLIGTGSPFDPIDFQGRKQVIGQGNNVFIFPGVGLGVVASGAKRVTTGMFLAAAKALADKITPEQRKAGQLFPYIHDIREISFEVAKAVAETAIEEGLVENPDELWAEGLDHRIQAETWYPQYLPYRYIGD
ncbi:MAG: NAD-dependent malic enzyme [Planctomycetota bacterium]|nr:MAG: NAD-dependent malic enzyme [Planctomycetota bacterium]